MQERFSGTTRRKVSHFILGEEGRVGSKSAFTAAAVVSVVSLLGIVQKTHASDMYCGVNGGQDVYCVCTGWTFCCGAPGLKFCSFGPAPGQPCAFLC